MSSLTELDWHFSRISYTTWWVTFHFCLYLSTIWLECLGMDLFEFILWFVELPGCVDLSLFQIRILWGQIFFYIQIFFLYFISNFSSWDSHNTSVVHLIMSHRTIRFLSLFLFSFFFLFLILNNFNWNLFKFTNLVLLMTKAATKTL